MHRAASRFQHNRAVFVQQHPRFQTPVHRPGEEERCFHLMELVDELIGMLDGAFSFEWLQDRFSACSVVHLGVEEEVDFRDDSLRQAGFALAVSLAHGEPPTHPGNLPEKGATELMGITTCHLAAVAAQGCAHVVLDQAAANPAARDASPNGQQNGKSEGRYDSQRVRRAKDNYFVPYLIALLQKLVLNHVATEAAALENWERLETQRGTNAKRVDEQHKEHVARLRRRLIRFSLSGDLPQISTRGTVQRFYRAVQEVNEIPSFLARVREALATHHELDLTEEFVTIQKKVEIIEVFLITVYLLELYHLVMEVSRHHGGLLASICFAARMMIFAAIWRLIDPPTEPGLKKPWYWALVAVVVTGGLACATHFWDQWQGTGEKAGVEDTQVEHSENH